MGGRRLQCSDGLATTFVCIKISEDFVTDERAMPKKPQEDKLLNPDQVSASSKSCAEMNVVVIPSLSKQSHLYRKATSVINSLLDIRPENRGLPPFEDWIDGTLPLEPWHIGGPVIKGYVRGLKLSLRLLKFVCLLRAFDRQQVVSGLKMKKKKKKKDIGVCFGNLKTKDSFGLKFQVELKSQWRLLEK
ncbi:bifunctional riboflavin kinase/FMN phosphatase [Tanacetum coccineum]